ncbi:MAG: putative hydrolase [Ilumatobacteraceae bacterium]|nr:putative hydrolase [Ilumatobacteraceae bacterium]
MVNQIRAVEPVLPWLPEGRTLVVPGRGEMFFRHHRHPDPAAPTLLLLHGWTASADLQFFAAYEALAQRYSFVAPDHRGHGRGMRPGTPFTLEDAAEDAAGLVRALGIERVVSVGYSMGGPISLLLARAHPELVQALIVQATALDWNETLPERLRWKTVRVVSPVLRSWAYPRWVRLAIRKILGEGHPMAVYSPWLAGELHRNDAFALVQAGQAIGRFDARPWAGALAVPAGSLITTNDRLVKPKRQRELAAALDAVIEEIGADHLAALVSSQEYIAATLRLLQRLVH